MNVYVENLDRYIRITHDFVKEDIPNLQCTFIHKNRWNNEIRVGEMVLVRNDDYCGESH